MKKPGWASVHEKQKPRRSAHLVHRKALAAGNVSAVHHPNHGVAPYLRTWWCGVPSDKRLRVCVLAQSKGKAQGQSNAKRWVWQQHTLDALERRLEAAVCSDLQHDNVLEPDSIQQLS